MQIPINIEKTTKYKNYGYNGKGGQFMTTSQIIKELNHLPSFLYIYWGPIYEKDIMVILGGQSCQQKDNHTGIIPAMHYNYEMQEICEKDILDESDKHTLVRAMRHIQNLCDYRDPNLYTLTQQEEYLNKLSTEELEEIYKQIEMYKLARSLYRDYH